MPAKKSAISCVLSDAGAPATALRTKPPDAGPARSAQVVSSCLNPLRPVAARFPKRGRSWRSERPRWQTFFHRERKRGWNCGQNHRRRLRRMAFERPEAGNRRQNAAPRSLFRPFAAVSERRGSATGRSRFKMASSSRRARRARRASRPRDRSGQAARSGLRRAPCRPLRRFPRPWRPGRGRSKR